ncbi:alpha/beta hydrolase [Kibdelosporangium lantanae]
MSYRFDPELAAWAGSPAPSLDDVPRLRAQMNALVSGSRPDDGLKVEDVVLPGGVPVRVYAPRVGDRPMPALLYLHGGGFVLGSVELSDGKAARYAVEADLVVVSVDYRLAPEHPFPAGTEDAYAALEWLAANADALGVAADRIAVGGNSAGAGIAAGLALLARDRGGPPVCFQFLDSPMLDDRMATTSARTFDDVPNWTSSAARQAWRYYVGAAGPDVSPYAAPARATDLAGLPPAHVTACEFDPLRDEAIEYAHRMVQAGVSVDLRLYPGTFHGSIWADAGISRRMFADQMTALRAGVSRRPAAHR